VLGAGVSEVHSTIESIVTAVSILGGAMAYESGLAAVKTMAANRPARVLSQRVNEGLGVGFLWGAPLALVISIVFIWT
jgi:hypothetical protein